MLPWILLFAALVLVALAVIGSLAWRLWRKVQALGREVSRASDRVGALTQALGEAQVAHGAHADRRADTR